MNEPTPLEAAGTLPVPGSPADAAADESEIADAVPPEAEEDPEQERAEELCREMVELTAHISAAEARFLELLAEFDRERMWLRYGCHSAVQWLNWKCGLGEVAARERVRVARALETLPKIRNAFRRGEVSYSKVREMTRIAIPESEETLLMIARHGTAAHMQRLVRKYRRVERLEAAAEALEQHRRRYVHYRHDEDGMLVIEARLPAEIGELVVKAIDAAVEVLYQDGLAEKRNAAASAEVDAEAAASAEVDAQATASAEVDAQAANNSVETESDVPAEAPSAGTALVSEPNVPAGTEAPDGHAVIEEFEGAGWADSLGARKADGLRLLAETFLSADQPRVDTSADRYQVVVHIDQVLLGSGADRRNRADRDDDPYRGVATLFAHCELEECGQALAVETARRLACDCALVGLVDGEHGEPLNVGRKTRAISPALKRALRARDGGCRFPGCGRTRFTHGHHIIHWADGGETKLSNLILACSFHHALLHEGGFSVKRMDDGTFAFFAPNGERLPETGQLDRETIEPLTDAAAHGRVTLRQLNREHGLHIDEETGNCRWLGERMDYHMAVGGLIWTRDHAQELASNDMQLG